MATFALLTAWPPGSLNCTMLASTHKNTLSCSTCLAQDDAYPEVDDVQRRSLLRGTAGVLTAKMVFKICPLGSGCLRASPASITWAGGRVNFCGWIPRVRLWESARVLLSIFPWKMDDQPELSVFYGKWTIAGATINRKRTIPAVLSIFHRKYSEWAGGCVVVCGAYNDRIYESPPGSIHSKEGLPKKRSVVLYVYISIDLDPEKPVLFFDLYSIWYIYISGVDPGGPPI